MSSLDSNELASESSTGLSEPSNESISMSPFLEMSYNNLPTFLKDKITQLEAKRKSKENLKTNRSASGTLDIQITAKSSPLKLTPTASGRTPESINGGASLVRSLLSVTKAATISEETVGKINSKIGHKKSNEGVKEETKEGKVEVTKSMPVEGAKSKTTTTQ